MICILISCKVNWTHSCRMVWLASLTKCITHALTYCRNCRFIMLGLLASSCIIHSPPPTHTHTGWTKFLEDKYSSLASSEREALLERMSIIQENPWVKDEM